MRCCCSCRGRLCSQWHDPCGEQQFHAVQLKARWNLGEQLAWLTDICTLWCCYWIGADTIKSSPSVLYHLCRVAAFQLHFLAEQLLVVCWEATCVCVWLGCFLRPYLQVQADPVVEERVWEVFVPRPHHISQSWYFCWFAWSLLVPMKVAGLSLISCFVGSFWAWGSQRPAAGWGRHWVTSRSIWEPFCAAGREPSQRKPCRRVVAACPWRLCWHGQVGLTAKIYWRFLAK